LVAVLEYRHVLERKEEFGNIVLRDEESSEKHEGNDKDWSEGDGKLFVAEHHSYNERVARCGIVDKE
jgi:hypothetical protein